MADEYTGEAYCVKCKAKREFTGEMLLKMPMDEFEAWCAKNPAKAKRLMGG